MPETPEFMEEIKTIATSEAFSEVLNRLEDRVIQDWRNSNLTDDSEQYWYTIRAIIGLRDEIKSIATTPNIIEWNRRLRGKTT